MECSICLQSINEKKHCIKTLSCGHKYHHKCYMQLVFNSGNLFINCPLCRETNVCCKPAYEDPFLDLKEICCTERCTHKTKEGKRCKKKGFFLNNGCCKIHNKNYLSEDRYSLIREFIHWVLMTGNQKKTKIIMIDIVKNLLLKYQDIKNIPDIQYYFHKYYHLRQEGDRTNVLWTDFYLYYDLEELNKEWFNTCMKQNIIY
jgi:hypothetical protein